MPVTVYVVVEVGRASEVAQLSQDNVPAGNQVYEVDTSELVTEIDAVSPKQITSPVVVRLGTAFTSIIAVSLVVQVPLP